MMILILMLSFPKCVREQDIVGPYRDWSRKVMEAAAPVGYQKSNSSGCRRFGGLRNLCLGVIMQVPFEQMGAGSGKREEKAVSR